tara:strand:- start:28360 stop:29874 length:1515 start_codon:yes stop_codon:yes gene_type:complete
MEADREHYLNRAKQVAELTLPHLMPPDGYSGGHLPTPYQSMGARGISSLASKQLMSLFPPGHSMMRYQISPAVKDEMSQGDGQVKAEIEAALAATENAISVELESQAMRPKLHQMFLQRLVSGNVLLHSNPINGHLKVFPLDRYVIKRDPEGNPLVIITKECVSKVLLPPEMLATVEDVQGESEESMDLAKDTFEIYTAVVREDKKTYKVWQEVLGVPVPGTEGTYEADKLPWIPVRSDATPGQSYSYGYMSGLLGDLASLEGLTKALVDGAAASSRLVFLVSPNSATNLREIQACPNGGFVAGMPDDVTSLKTDKANDMAVAFNMIERLSKSLGFAFLLNQSVQRSGERVTAEEIRFLAQELEDVQAGDYSLLAQELQLPLTRVILDRLERTKQVPKVDKSVAEPSIVTGLEALSRGHDLRKLEMLLNQIGQLVGPQGIGKYANLQASFKRFETALGLSGESIIRSPEEIQQIEQQEQQNAAMQSMGPEVIRQVGAATQPGAE